ALQVSSELLETLDHNDPFGVSPLGHAIQALANAALGDTSAARTALEASVDEGPGVSAALHGFVSFIRLRTRHWLRDPDLKAHAQRLAAWAAEEELALIELKALDIIAH